MKQIFWLFPVLLVWTSCNNDDQSRHLKEAFKSYLQGAWLKTDYMDDVSKTRSPFKSYSKLEGVVSLLIDQNITAGDSLNIGYSLNNHEGSDFFLYFKPGIKPNSLPVDFHDSQSPTNYFELGYVVNGTDTSLVLYHYSRDKKFIDSVGFTKVHQYAPPGGDVGEAIQYFVNKLLITGDYKVTDSAGKETKVHFSDQSKVTGFGNYSDYLIATDFMGPDQGDFIGIGKADEQYSVFYGWESKGDSIKLYESHEDTATGAAVVGKLQFVLKKL